MTVKAPVARSRRPRLDVFLVNSGLVESRRKAQALVMAGHVTVDGVPAHKPGQSVALDAEVAVAAPRGPVSRGALKLQPALDALAVAPVGRVCLDVGASTGGFTEVLLDAGATRVYAVDVGRGQLHERLAGDPRVVVVDRVNARYLTEDHVPERPRLAVIDVSFISVLKVLPAVVGVLDADADVVALVKPQFELARGDVGRGGIVTDPESHARAITSVAEGTPQPWTIVGGCASPIRGAEGNREFFLHVRRGAKPVDVGSLVTAMVSA